MIGSLEVHRFTMQKRDTWNQIEKHLALEKIDCMYSVVGGRQLHVNLVHSSIVS